MKKYITIAALLAAGTAFANAVELTDAKITTSETSTTIPANTLWGDHYYTLVFKVDAMKSLLGNNQIDRVMFAATDAGRDIAFGTTAGNTGFAGFNTNNITAPTTDGYAMTGNASTPSPNNFSSSYTWENLTSFAASLVHYNKNSTSIYITANFSDGGSIDLYGTNSSLKWSDGIGQIKTLKLNTDYVEKAYMFLGTTTRDDILALNDKAIAAAVPEPSAFGLLAGIGALALVASRRRRK